MKEQANKTSRARDEVAEMRQQLARLQKALDIRQRVAFAAGLFEGEVTLRTLIGSLAEGFVVIDDEQRIILVNQRLEEMFGYAREEIVAQTLDVLLPQRFAQAHRQHVQTYFQEPRIRPMGQGLELAARRKDGIEFPVEIALSFLDTKAGRFGLAFVIDITLRKQAEHALLAHNEALNAFAHTVAHDLQASVAIMVGLSEHLVEAHAGMSAPELQHHLATIARDGRKMSNIVSELLLLARMRKEETLLLPMDMAPVVEAALYRLRDALQHSQAEVSLPDSYPQALGYAPWVEEVWFNYISNALKYGGRPPRLEIGSTPQADGYVKFWVKDNGAGLTAARQEQLFKPGEGWEQPRGQGQGLGLSIVQQIVERLDGQVGVESEAGKGSVFSFSLLQSGRVDNPVI
jgi:PAS domain S-box-containing protein